MCVKGIVHIKINIQKILNNVTITLYFYLRNDAQDSERYFSLKNNAKQTKKYILKVIVYQKKLHFRKILHDFTIIFIHY